MPSESNNDGTNESERSDSQSADSANQSERQNSQSNSSRRYSDSKSRENSDSKEENDQLLPTDETINKVTISEDLEKKTSLNKMKSLDDPSTQESKTFKENLKERIAENRRTKRKIIDKKLDRVNIGLAVIAFISTILSFAIMEYQYWVHTKSQFSHQKFCPGQTNIYCPNEGILVTSLKAIMSLITIILIALLWKRSHLRFLSKTPTVQSECWDLHSPGTFVFEVFLNSVHGIPFLDSLLVAWSLLRVYLIVNLLRFNTQVKSTRLLMIESDLAPKQGMWISLKTIMRSEPWLTVVVMTATFIPLFSYVHWTLGRVLDIDNDLSFADALYDISWMFSNGEPYEAEGWTRIPAIMNSLSAAGVATLLFTGLQSTLELDGHEESAMNTTLIKRLNKVIRKNAARIIWFQWTAYKIKRQNKRRGKPVEKKASLMGKRKKSMTYEKAMAKKIICMKIFKKNKVRLYELTEIVENNVGVVPTILSTKGIIETNQTIINDVDLISKRDFRQMFQVIKGHSAEIDHFQRQFWQTTMKDITVKIDTYSRVQQRIESSLLTKIYQMEKQNLEKQQQLSKQLLMIKEEQKKKY